MIFMFILFVIFVITTVLLGVYYYKEYSYNALLLSLMSGVAAVVLLICIIWFGVEAKQNKALIRAHLDNPSNYTYSQLAIHNELITKLRVWHGTIFSFYNDTELQIIDIDNISQKVIIDTVDQIKD